MKIIKNFYAWLEKLLHDADVALSPSAFVDRVLILCIIFGAIGGAVASLYGMLVTAIVVDAIIIGLPMASIALLVMRADKRTAELEDMLLNFLSMMASNIRSGVTYDRALLLSSRKEFGSLAKEIDRAAKHTIAGMPLTDALMLMAKHTRSETFAKTMRLIVEGVNAGGNLAEMLEITAIDIRRSSSLKKEISATVLVYKLFIFAAAIVGAPLLYALTGFLIEIFVGIRTNSVSSGSASISAQLPMFSSGAVISSQLFFIYALLAIVMTVFLSTLASGVITKGRESEGLPDFGWAVIIAYGIFFGVRQVFGSLLGSFIH